MDRKQGIIHLGRSRSPSRPINKSTASQHFRQPSATSRQKQQQQESTLNRSLNIKSPSKVVRIDNVNYANTSPVFFPPSQKIVHQRPVLRQNFDLQTSQKVAFISNSPFKRVVVSRTLSNNENNPQKQQQGITIQKQNQLLRKIKVLQSRIQQIHQQKQSLLVRTHEETKRLVNDNLILKNRIQQYSNINSREISQLRNQNGNLKNILKTQSQVVRVDRVERTAKPTVLSEQYKNISEKDHASLKNAAYFQEQQQTVSIMNNSQHKEQKKYKSKQNENFKQPDNLQQTNKLRVQNQQLHQKLKQQDEQIEKWRKSYKELGQKLQNSQRQKNKLKEQIDNINKQIFNHSSIIQENNKNIVLNYQNKINMISGELDQTKAQLTHIVGEYEHIKQQMDSYVRKMFQTDQQNQKKQAQWIIQVNNSAQMTELMKQKYQQALKKIDELEHTIKTIKQNETTSKTESAPTHIQEQSKKQECKKCKQLIKTLLKLNQKVYSRTT